MSQEPDQRERTEFPIERGFPIEQLNDIAEKESYGGARQWYRPIYTMHKWWARRLGSVFRAISLYSLLDDPADVDVFEPGADSQLGDFTSGAPDIANLIDEISLEQSDSLWSLYPKDVRLGDKKVLDPFMGGGTSLIEASRFGAEVHGQDINPVAWFISKKEVDTGHTDPEALQDAYETIEESVKEELKSHYKTRCPNEPDTHDADLMNSLWVKQLDCTSCGEVVPLFGDYRVGKGRFDHDDKYHVYCPDCESVVLCDDWRSESTCGNCGYEFIPQEGTVSGSKYTCHDCGHKYSVTEAIQEQDGYKLKYYATEYHCPDCEEDKSYGRSAAKGYRAATDFDIDQFEASKAEWQQRDELHQYVPTEEIPKGAITVSSSINGNDVFQHGYETWADMFNERQKLCLATILSEIDAIENENAREYLLLTFTDFLCRNSMMCAYSQSANQVNHLFKTNSFDPPMRPTESNVWGADYGTGTFESTWRKVIRGVKWGREPTDRYIEYPDKDGYPMVPRSASRQEPDTIETEPFNYPVGQNTTVSQGDVRSISATDEYDAIITDPPYYDNVMYADLSDYFYVWQKILLEDEYEWFEDDQTPKQESIVTNPFLGKDEEDFESDLHEAFSVLREAIKEDGILTFTYHHSGPESWGELLQSLCEAGFEVTATYPISVDIAKFIGGETVDFDIVIVARPAGDKEQISWRNLRRKIMRTTKQIHARLTETRDLSEANISVIEMGRAFHEYSKYHGEVRRGDEIMDAKDVVDGIYGILRDASDIGELDVYLDLADTASPSYSDLNMLVKGTDADPDRMRDMKLYRMNGSDFELLDWTDDDRIAYIQSRVNGDDASHLTALDKAHFLRYRFERGETTENYVNKWGVRDGLRDMCESLAEITGDETYRRLLGGDSSLSQY
ncbi:DUF1156 domain-containing protein [Halosegnis marinus]|uniref:DUF1156 domain-containing protein n=1 Tax=Halosegnis marinus TaxID=3034023 RepID=A0ABD5ZT73_9EURY|nr:DUF1156 domain-containing protein [Halosegnis sp. DT85]